MGRINLKLVFLVFGVFILHTVTGQTGTGTAGAAPIATAAMAIDPTSSPNIRTDVTDTVMALLNETGYSGSANDANVQEIVAMLMNGTVPTDADLIRLGFIPQPAPSQATTPPPYVIPGQPAVVDPSLSFQTNNLPTGTQSGALQPGTPPLNGGFPNIPPLGVPQTGPGTGSGTGGGTDPFGGALSNLPGTGAFPNFPLGSPGTTSKPALGDPFNMNSLTMGGPVGLPSLGALDPNALGPKPFQSGGPIGGLGTPGSPTDLLGVGPLGSIPPGNLGGLPPAPQIGILEHQQNQRNRGGIMSNPMMMMMMLNPEIMDQMMSGENPMLMYLLMQQMRRPQRPAPSAMSGSGLSPGMGGLGGLSGLPGGPGGAGAGMSPSLPGGLSLGGGPGGLMDLTGAGSPPPGGLGALGSLPIDLTALTGGLGAPVGPTPAGVNPIDLLQGSLPGAGGAGGALGAPAGPADLSPFLNMINPGAAGTGPSGAPLTDPVLGTVG